MPARRAHARPVGQLVAQFVAAFLAAVGAEGAAVASLTLTLHDGRQFTVPYFPPAPAAPPDADDDEAEAANEADKADGEADTGPPLSPCEEEVWALVRERPGLNAEALTGALNGAEERYSQRTVERAISELKRRGLIDNPRRGAGYWSRDPS